MNILHVSDLHYAAGSHDIEVVRDALLKDVAWIKSEVGPLDLVLFTGDLVARGQDEAMFREAHREVLEPLLGAVGVSAERLFATPGNHDLDVTKIDEYLEAGLLSKLHDPVSCSRFVDEVAKHPAALDRLTNFNRYGEFLYAGRGTVVERNALYSTHSLQLGKSTVGIACLNSAWRATGRPNNADYQKLLLTERQVERAAASLEKADIRVALFHHPLEWLAQFDRGPAGRRLLNAFDIACFGHHHEAEPAALHSLLSETITSQAGCLYHSRHFFNGYTVLVYDQAARACTVYLREYSDARREFDKCTRLAPEGTRVFSLTPRAFAEGRAISVPVADALNAYLSDEFSQHLLSAHLETAAPKDFKQIVVPPRLSAVQEQVLEVESARKLNPKASRYINVQDLIQKQEHVLILGKKQHGRTTALHWLALELTGTLERDLLRLPVYLNFRDLRNVKAVKARLYRAIGALLAAVGVKGESSNVLDGGRCVLLIDDVDPNDGPRMDALKALLAEAPKCRWVIAVDEDISRLIDFDAPLDLGAPYVTYFLHSFGRGQTRALVARWRSGLATKSKDPTVDDLLNALRRIGMPVTPFLVSAVLWVFESKRYVGAINHAALVESLLENLLEKAATGIRATLDYRNKEHYLTHIAWRMVVREAYEFERFELEQETIAYFSALGIRASAGQLVAYMLERGVFDARGDIVAFKYRCFCQYFIAKKLMESSDAYAHVIRADTYLAFADELDILTGLQRNNLDLLLQLEQWFDVAIEAAGPLVDVHLFDTVESVMEPLPEGDRSSLLARFRKAKPGLDRREEMLDAIAEPSLVVRQEIERTSPRERTEAAVKALLIFSRVLRNCELLPEEVKARTIAKLFEFWAQLLVALAIVAEEFARDVSEDAAAIEAGDGQAVTVGDGEVKSDAEDAQLQLELEEAAEEPSGAPLDAAADEESEIFGSEFEKAQMMRLVLPTVVQGLLRESLGTEKLEQVLEARIANRSASIAEQLLQVGLYSDLRLPHRFVYLKDLVNNVGDRPYVLELVLIRLAAHYMYEDLSGETATYVEGLMGDALAALAGGGRRRGQRAATKREAIKELRRRRRLWIAAMQERGQRENS